MAEFYKGQKVKIKKVNLEGTISRVCKNTVYVKGEGNGVKFYGSFSKNVVEASK